MKFITCILTLALMQMTCLADGFYFCFKPACTKTYLKFTDKKQLKSHLAKNHKCNLVSDKIVQMSDGTKLDFYYNLTHDFADDNSLFAFAESNSHMKKTINEVRNSHFYKSSRGINNNSEPLIVMSNMRRCNKCNQEVPVRFFDAHDIDHQRSEMRQYNRTQTRNFMNGGRF